MTTSTYPQKAGHPRQVGWFTAVGIHAGRILTRWFRAPSVVVSAIAMPTLMIVMTMVTFKGMVQRFNGGTMNLASVSMMVGVSTAFTGALMGAGSTVHERHQGLPERLATLPGHASTGFMGRVLAESIKAIASLLTALLVGYIGGANFGGAASLTLVVAAMLLVGVAAGAVGVMLGYVVETPQGAVSFVPIIMAAMFFNTALMPRELYAAALRPLVDISPVTAVTQIARDIVIGVSDSRHVLKFLGWYVGLIVLSLVVLFRKGVARRS